jgi:hypothetical protein
VHFGHFSLIAARANCKIVLVLNEMVLVLLLETGWRIEYEYEYRRWLSTGIADTALAPREAASQTIKLLQATLAE